MSELKFHPDISSEIKNTYDWYQKQADGLGDDFLYELELSFQAIIELPNTWPKLKKSFRRYILSRFPFSIIYKKSTNAIYVIAIMHNRRTPSYWLSRLL